MKVASGLLFSIALVGISHAAPQVERALPSGHPVIDNEFLSENGLATGYTIKDDIYPTGFAIPDEPITALPSGYSVAPEAVYDPEGNTVSAFPSEALAQVIAETMTTADPGAPSPSAETDEEDTNSAISVSRASTVSFGLISVAVAMGMFL